MTTTLPRKCLSLLKMRSTDNYPYRSSISHGIRTYGSAPMDMDTARNVPGKLPMAFRRENSVSAQIAFPQNSQSN